MTQQLVSLEEINQVWIDREGVVQSDIEIGSEDDSGSSPIDIQSRLHISQPFTPNDLFTP